MANHVTSKEMIITVILDPNGDPDIKSVEFDDGGIKKTLPKVGEKHPGNPNKIEKEKGTNVAAVFAQLKWHHHNPDCITFEIGGAQYQICF
jgi:hypothetical protein